MLDENSKTGHILQQYMTAMKSVVQNQRVQASKPGQARQANVLLLLLLHTAGKQRKSHLVTRIYGQQLYEWADSGDNDTRGRRVVVIQPSPSSQQSQPDQASQPAGPRVVQASHRASPKCVALAQKGEHATTTTATMMMMVGAMQQHYSITIKTRARVSPGSVAARRNATHSGAYLLCTQFAFYIVSQVREPCLLYHSLCVCVAIIYSVYETLP